MELRQLHTFRAVAQTLSFTRTAELLNYAQSSVTAQIQALEEELGAPLFERLGRKVVMTEPGERLLQYAEKMLHLADEARVAVPGGETPSGTLVIGAPESVCAYRLPQVLMRFRQLHPQVRVIFRPGSCTALHRAVSDGAIDVAFTLETPAQLPTIVLEPLLKEPLQVLAPADHAFVGRKGVNAADIHGETLVVTEEGCAYRNLFERALAQAGAVPGTTLEFSSVEAIKQCVATGMGLTVLPAYAVQEEVADRRLVALDWVGTPLVVTNQVVWHKDKWHSPAMRAFLAVTREIFAQL